MRILSRYTLREFLSCLGYALLAFIAIFILVDLVDRMDKFIDAKAGMRIIALYYVFYLPWVISLVTPVAMLLATMFSLGRLVGDNEIIAMKASGISLYRILFPLYVFALCIGLVMMVFAEVVVPKANQQKTQIEKFIDARRHGDFGARYSLSLFSSRERNRHDVFLANGDGRIVYAEYYIAGTHTATNVAIITPETLTARTGARGARILSRIDADSMVYREHHWVLRNVVSRTFLQDGVRLDRVPALDASFINREPSDFAQVDRRPDAMNFLQLREYIQRVRAKGGDASEWLVDLYMKISFPFVSFVIVFFGAPMVAGSMKRGKASGFGVALMISFAFYAFINIFQVLGRSGAVNPLLAAWISNLFFFGLGLIMHVRAST